LKPLRPPEISGNWATLLLPIRPDECIDQELPEAEVSHFGAAGEFYTQTEDVFDHVNRILAGGCERLRLPFQIGVSHMSPQLSLGRLRRGPPCQNCSPKLIRGGARFPGR
jgi:4-hydroxy-tetrahydrodipicolinate synthase